MILASSDAGGDTSQKQRTKIAASPFLGHRIDWKPLILILLALVLALWRLDVAPPLFWDEGWTLMVARTWVERGHYGRLLAGQPVSPRLSAAFPVVAPIALSFRLLGVGIWQGRLVVVLYTLGALLLLYFLARRFYDRRIATGTLVVALLMSPLIYAHPLYIGRMVLAETPMLVFLLAGYACCLLTLCRSGWFMPLTLLCWGLGLFTKVQPLPFWAASLVVPLVLMLLRRQWRVASWLGIGLIGSLGAEQLLSRLWRLWLWSGAPGGPPLTTGLIGASALVPVAHVRLTALNLALLVGIPTVLGVGHATWKSIKHRNEGASNAELDAVRWALLILVGTWFAWFVLLSVGWPRYLFPATFVGSMFAAALLCDWTEGFRLSSTIKRARHALRHRRFHQRGGRALLAVALLAWTVPTTIFSLASFSLTGGDTSVQQVADFLNTQTAPDALIEGYSSELFFLLDRPYHYPPDEVNVAVIRWFSWRQAVPIEYDPLSADPDYLVVSRNYVTWVVYDAVLKSDAFRLLRIIGPYEVYERVR